MKSNIKVLKFTITPPHPLFVKEGEFLPFTKGEVRRGFEN
jgi:hypothetical protein